MRFQKKEPLSAERVIEIYTSWASCRPSACVVRESMLSVPMSSLETLEGIGVVAAIYLNDVSPRILLPLERERARSMVMDAIENAKESGFDSRKLAGATNADAIAYMINCAIVRLANKERSTR